LLGTDLQAQSKWSVGFQGGITKFYSHQGTGSSAAYSGFQPDAGTDFTSLIYGRRWINHHFSAKLGFGLMNYSTGFKFEDYGKDQTKYGVQPQIELGVNYFSPKFLGDFRMFAGFGLGIASFPSRPSRVDLGIGGEVKIYSYNEVLLDGTEEQKDIIVASGTYEYTSAKELFFLRPEIGVDYRFSNGSSIFFLYQYSYKVGEDMARMDYSDLRINGSSYTQTQLFHGSYSAFQIGYEIRIR